MKIKIIIIQENAIFNSALIGGSIVNFSANEIKEIKFHSFQHITSSMRKSKAFSKLLNIFEKEEIK